MDQLNIKAAGRQRVQKGDNRKLRREGRVPAVVYGGAGQPVAISVDNHEIELMLRGASRSNAIFNLGMDGGEDQAIIRDIQRHPVTERLMHIDFMRVDMQKEIEVDASLHVTGDIPLGVRAGGVLEHLHRTVTIICRAADMIDRIDVDLSNFNINASFHVSDLVLPQGVRVVDEPETALFTILPPRKEAEETGATEAAPEVIGRKKEEKE